MVYIQIDEQGFPDNINCHNAYNGFSKLYSNIKLFQKEEDLKNALPEDIIVSHVGIVRNHLNSMGFDYPEICYPAELTHFLGRKITRTHLGNIMRKPESWPLFVKPVKGKQFVGTVVNSALDLIDFSNLPDDTEVFSSDVIKIVSEWRAFVRYGKILDVRHYSGDWKMTYDPNVIINCVVNYENSPSGYGIDFGVTSDGDTILLEVNDGYSLGCYGLFPVEYAKLLSARWAELTHTEDPYNF